MEQVERWEQQPGESAKAFEAFRLYRDMGPGRSQRAVAKTLGKSRVLISRWSAENEWVERVRDYENYLDRTDTEIRKRELRRTRARRAAVAGTIIDAVYQRLEALSPEDIAKTSLRSLAEILKLASDVQETALGPTAGEIAAMRTPSNEEQTSDWAAMVEAAYQYDAAREDDAN